MLAISERVPGKGNAPDELIWHKPVGRVIEEFQPIACSDQEGITLPWAKRDVPLKLDKPGESWCPDCLKLAKR